MSNFLKEFDTIKGFLAHEEGFFCMKWQNNTVQKVSLLKLDHIVANLLATLAKHAKKMELIL